MKVFVCITQRFEIFCSWLQTFLNGVLKKANAKINDATNDIKRNGMKRTELEKRMTILKDKTQDVGIQKNLTKTIIKHKCTKISVQR